MKISGKPKRGGGKKKKGNSRERAIAGPFFRCDSFKNTYGEGDIRVLSEGGGKRCLLLRMSEVVLSEVRC